MKRTLLIASALMALTVFQAPACVGQEARLRFEVTAAAGLVPTPISGRLFVVMSRGGQPEPRLTIGQTGMDASPMLARDVSALRSGTVEVVDHHAISFPIESLSRLPAGDYFVRAVFDSNSDLKSVTAPGNLYSEPLKVHLEPAQAQPVKLQLTRKVPAEELPAETEQVKFIKLQSELLSKFHKRPIFLRAAVILPRGYESETARRYPLRVHIGGYGDRFTRAQSMMSSSASFRRIWLADDTPRMVMLFLDGDGPFGDCYQVNSDNNGPYGDAVTRELIPYVEQKFRLIGQPYARFVEGGSTGGWVSLALQVFYPDFFNGVWSGFPDGVDFRQFQLIDIYSDDNAYVNEHGFERPSARDLNGDVRFTVRHECQMENVIGLGDSWTMSGEQWGAWNATYGPRGSDGRPVALWDPKSGKINRAVVDHWKKYDLRMVLEQNWKTLAPKLRGKITIWVGEADEYFLNNAVHLLDAFLSKASPGYEGKILYGPGKGHGWMGIGERQMMDEMIAAMEKGRR
ncbi:MAG TPA: alpha/beta hydrolase-fold protein [Blastocatellia bacterium]|nr:alpha/beta hydrolase-fold protein [Blastocatellia bacterium]